MKFLGVENFSYIWVFDLSKEKGVTIMRNISQIYNVAVRLKQYKLLKNNIMLIHNNGELLFYGKDDFNNFKFW